MTPSQPQTTAEAATYTLALCARIAAETDVPGTITRLFLSPATARVHARLTAEMHALGMAVRTDAIGNLRGTYPAQTHTPETLLLGSHIDTVPDAGPYDGILGVALPLAALRLLHSAGTRLPYNIELIAFSEEEGIRFQLPFLGSRALLGPGHPDTLTPADLARTDAQGITLAQAIRNFGLNPKHLEQALLTPHTFAFIELHIEQGPVLDTLNLPLAVVSTIVGQSRHELTFTGQANHAGTTPMPLRRDALTAAAAFILAAESLARATPALVGTVGRIEAHPGAPNVIPGRATCTLDLRHPDDATRLAHAEALLAEAARIAQTRGLTLATRELSSQPSVPLDAALIAALISAAPTAHTMPSGAGHDAMILASHLPSAMLFLRSPGGISHHPAESVLPQDIQAALEVLLHFLRKSCAPPSRPG